jgi:predicted deacylase
MTQIPIVRVGTGRPELWVVAGVHGDEVEGMACVEEALASLRPRTGTLVGVPVAHPAALVAGTRRGPDGVDLNRTYPGRPDGGPTKRAAHELWSQMQASGPDALVTLHSWSRSGAAHPHVEHARDDARGRELAHRLGLPFVLPFDWPEGLLPKVAVAHGIPSVELELGGLGVQTAHSLAHGLRAINAAAAWLGMIDGLSTRVEAETVERVAITAPTEGRLRHRRDLGEEVQRGDIVAEIRANDGSIRDVVVSPAGGWIGVHITYGHVTAGDEIAMLFTASSVAG